MDKVKLSNLFKNLKMDDNIVNTIKAEEYLKTRKEFRSDGSLSASETITSFDSCGNKVFCLPVHQLENLYTAYLKPIQDKHLSGRLDGLKKLAQEFEKEADLICQLEYLIRKIPVRETKHSIHLIVQHLTYSAENELINSEDMILVQNDTPLLALGCLQGSFQLYEYRYLFATNETAVICYLFTELCRNAGLNCVKLVIGEKKSVMNSTLNAKPYKNMFDDLLPEVTGVITDKSDLDSAVDTFLISENHPFPLTRIFVQESIYKEFKDILAWKCKSPSNINIILKPNCTEAFKYENKTLYLDYAGNVEENENRNVHIIFIEAYRTVSELLSLLNKSHKRLCLSLWASGVSEANEIALNVSVPVTWINDYYNFTGPNKISQVIFDKTYYRSNIDCHETIVKQLNQRQKVWMNLTFNERYKTVLKVFEGAGLRAIIKGRTISQWKDSDFVTVEDKTMIIGFHVPIPIVSFCWSEFEIDSNFDNPKTASIWLSIAKALISGSAIAYRIQSSKYDNESAIFQTFEDCGLPVAKVEESDYTNSKIKMRWSYSPLSARTKMIWTNFGTKFAN